jgi:uncharacterized Rmd1/YagE family protein
VSLDQRTQVLNKRLDIIRDLFEVLGDELNSRHSGLMEWAIVVLILMELIVSLLTHVFKIL